MMDNILKKLKSTLFTVFLVSAILLVGGCSNGSESPTDDQGDTATSVEETDGEETDSAGLEKITVSQPTQGILWAPMHLADILGFFEEEGLEVEFVTVQGDAPTAPVLAGEAQFGLFGPEMILGFNERGEDVKLLMSATDKYPYSLVAGEEYETVASLEGTTISAADSGSSPRQFVRMSLAQAGADPDAAEFINIQNQSIIPGLTSGEIAASHASPEILLDVYETNLNVLVDMFNEDTHREILDSDYYEMYITFTTGDFIEKNPETVQKYVNAVHKAIRWMDENDAQTISDELEVKWGDLERRDEIVALMMENDLFSSTGEISEEGYAAINEVAKMAEITEGDVPYEEAVDSSFLENAIEEGQ